MANSVSLEELVALNDEIVGLVRSGLPLELGLSGWGRGLPGRLKRLMRQLAHSLEQGKSLPQSLDECATRFPPIYRALVEAGVRSGRLSSALEALATSARQLQDMRRALVLALLYPLVLILLAYFAFWLLLTHSMPAVLGLYEGNPPRMWAAMTELGQLTLHPMSIPGTGWKIAVGWLPPLLFLGFTLLALVGNLRGSLLGGASGRLAEWLPLSRRVVVASRHAALAEIMGLLVRQNVPLDEAVMLAAECTDDGRLIHAARRLADQIKRGGSPEKAGTDFPPLLAWLVSQGGRQDAFVAIAGHVAATQRQRAAEQLRWMREYLPMWIVLIVGGTLTVLLAIGTLLPFLKLMHDLSLQQGASLRIGP